MLALGLKHSLDSGSVILFVYFLFKSNSRLFMKGIKLYVVLFRPGFERASRKARDLAAKYNLGNPVAGNLFQSEHEG